MAALLLPAAAGRDGGSTSDRLPCVNDRMAALAVADEAG
jgi:hypothetical protein